MGSIKDFFNSLFGGKDDRKDRIGPDDLPRDIMEDLMNQPSNSPPQHFSYFWQYPPPNDQENHHHHHHGHHHWPGFGPGFGGPFNHHQHPHGHDDDGDDDNEHFHFNEGSHPGDFFQEFDEFFQNFFQGFPGIGFQPNIPGIELPPNYTEPDKPDDKSLREKMLKPEEPSPSHPQDVPSSPGHPFRSPFGGFGGEHRQPQQKDLWDPQKHGDKDLDAALQDGNMSLDDVLSQQQEQPRAMQPHRGHVFSQGFSSKSSTIMHGNGATETCKTTKDSQGTEEVTVTRTLGNQSHTRTYKTDKHGNQEVIEDMTNMGQDDLKDFEEKWSQVAGSKQRWNQPMIPHMEPPHSLYDSVKDFFFPRR